MREYELTYLISDNVPESDLNKVTGKVGGYIADCGGKVLKEEIWGRRKLAYPIQKQDFATYVTLNFSLPANKAAEFEKNIFLTGKILRHLMIVKDFGKEELTLTTEDIAQTEEIETAVGGEKSFEAVVGETEESRDLMAKREKVEEEEQEALEAVEKAVEEATPVEPAEAEAEAAPAEKVKTEKTKEESAKKPAKKVVKKAAKATKEEKPENEADRLTKLDKELDDILGDDL